MKNTELWSGKEIISRKDNVILRKIHGSFFLVDIKDQYNDDRCSIFEINETGSFIWNAVKQSATLAEIASELQSSIADDIDYNMLYNDVKDFIESLLHNNFIEVRYNG